MKGNQTLNISSNTQSDEENGDDDETKTELRVNTARSTSQKVDTISKHFSSMEEVTVAFSVLLRVSLKSRTHIQHTMKTNYTLKMTWFN